MNKSSHFSGQPIFSQLIKLIPRSSIVRLSQKHQSDRYYKKFKTFEHLTTMLYAIWSNCSSIREVTTGLLACSGRISHLGMSYFPRRSTLSDANCKRSHQVFEDIYQLLYERLIKSLPDSQTQNWFSKLFILDSSTISLFQAILKNAGRSPMNGKRKGGVKAHMLIKADQDVPCFVKLTAAAAHDTPFMRDIDMPKGSIVVFDKGYHDYQQLAKWDEKGIYFVSRIYESASYKVLENYQLDTTHTTQGVLKDQLIFLGHRYHNNVTRLALRLVTYCDYSKGKTYRFYTNITDLPPTTIADIYRQRWQIEVLFKRLKQNFPLKYFLGDNVNAIKIQIWCVLIADLLLKYVRGQAIKNWSYANLASMIRLHLMTYINLFKFLSNPEAALKPRIQKNLPWNLFPT